MTATDPFEVLYRAPAPRRPRPQFAAALRRRIEEELNVTTASTAVKKPAMFHIRVPDADRAMRFFGAVLDWEGERVEYQGHIRHYMTNTEGSQPVLTDEHADWAVRMGFTVDDVDEIATAIEALGGRITEREERYALADDDQGVPLVVWIPGDPHPHAPPTKPASGKLDWFEVKVPEPERANRFYGELLGWRITQYEPGAYWHVVDEYNGSEAGITQGDAVLVTPCATVDDIKATRARIVAAGGHADEPTPMGPGIGCDCVDDQGTHFSLWQAV